MKTKSTNYYLCCTGSGMENDMMKALENLSDRITVNYENKPCYDIVFSKDFHQLVDELRKFNICSKRLCIVTESNVAPLYAEHLKNLIEPHCKKIIVYEFPAGESRKNVATIDQIYETLIVNQFDRNDMLIALGGGVTGDMTGFAAATYLRGIDFIQVPTSLLAQVDSSIGGKTGVDFKSYKNMVGAFYMPKLVYMNLSTLNTLSEREYLSGMGEILKHGLIKDQEYWGWLSENRQKILDKDYETLKKMIFVSCNIKRTVVENDPKEKGERALLNFGHTIGHAVEKVKNFSLLHGECVAIGLAAASYLSMTKGYISPVDYSGILSVISDFLLPVTTDGIEAEEVVNATLNDKKMDSGVIKFILIHGIGNGVIDRTVTRDMMLEATRTILKN
ncbi:MAG: 3-dehydroquinate synthase [Eubacterium sp.]